MPATAPDRKSVPQRQPAVNPKTIEITATRQRCDYLRDVLYDKRLSSGARLLYVALDDYAGLKAEAWPHQQTLADRLGMSLRSVELWTAELKRSGYVIARKTSHGNRYRLAWCVPPEATHSDQERPATGCGSQPQPAAVPYKEEPNQEPEQQQPDCCCVDFRDVLSEVSDLLNGI